VVVFGLTLAMMAAVGAKGGPADPAGSGAGEKTSVSVRAAQRAGAGPMGQAPSGQSGESKLADALRLLRQARINAKDTTPVSTSPPAPTTRPVRKPAGSAPAKGQPTTRPTAKATTRPAAAAPAGDNPATAAERALARLKAIDDKDIPDPLALADALYLAGRKPAAVIFYTKALKRAPADAGADRAWILYQLGNCHRVSDPPVAAGYYTRVVSEHRDSDWAVPSKVQADLIQWYRQNTPAELIKTAITGTKAP